MFETKLLKHMTFLDRILFEKQVIIFSNAHMLISEVWRE